MDAGSALASLLSGRLGGMDTVIVALPRGGVPVASRISKALRLPLDVFLVRKFALPKGPEPGAGSVASGGVFTVNSPSLLTAAGLDEILVREHAAITRREHAYRGTRSAQPIRGRCAIVVDDGLTTGSTMRAAIAALRLHNPAQIIAAVPVASADVSAELESVADSVVCARIPAAFSSVRRCYTDYSPVLDEEIRRLLASAALDAAPRAFHA